jgi:hypothetical protein
MSHHLTVYLLAVIEDKKQEQAATLRLVNLSALISAFTIENETRLVSGGNWIREVQEVWQVGDQIVCQAEQTIIDQKMNRMLLSNALSISLRTPVILVTGLYLKKLPGQSEHLSELKWWGGASIILIALGGIMYYLNKTTSGWVESVLQIFAFLIAVIMIWSWNKNG